MNLAYFDTQKLSYNQYFFNEVHPPYFCDPFMSAIIQESEKKKMLPYIKSNFGKLSNREMAKELGIGKTSVNRWCKELDLIVVKDSVNEDFFEAWSQDMAYILGLIFADGNISWDTERSYRALTITAREKDSSHLEKIRSILQSTKPLSYSKKTNSYRLIVNSKKLCEDLMGYGLTPRKSLSVKFPEVPEDYLKHFLRGVIDGDGNVRYVDRPRSPYFEITISSGSRIFLEKMAEAISSIGVYAKVRKVNDNLFILQYSCKRGMALAEWIYQDANLCLSRKLEQYNVALRAREVVLP